ncbi:hypothetical protein J6590_067169 [Homalodisca vitripennis]|nr:hypothetical protein J6590_067169 [Homalodisca vitripennis]
MTPSSIAISLAHTPLVLEALPRFDNDTIQKKPTLVFSDVDRCRSKWRVLVFSGTVSESPLPAPPFPGVSPLAEAKPEEQDRWTVDSRVWLMTPAAWPDRTGAEELLREFSTAGLTKVNGQRKPHNRSKRSIYPGGLASRLESKTCQVCRTAATNACAWTPEDVLTSPTGPDYSITGGPPPAKDEWPSEVTAAPCEKVKGLSGKGVLELELGSFWSVCQRGYVGYRWPWVGRGGAVGSYRCPQSYMPVGPWPAGETTSLPAPHVDVTFRTYGISASSAPNATVPALLPLPKECGFWQDTRGFGRARTCSRMLLIFQEPVPPTHPLHGRLT